MHKYEIYLKSTLIHDCIFSFYRMCRPGDIKLTCRQNYRSVIIIVIAVLAMLATVIVMPLINEKDPIHKKYLTHVSTSFFLMFVCFSVDVSAIRKTLKGQMKTTTYLIYFGYLKVNIEQMNTFCTTGFVFYEISRKLVFLNFVSQSIVRSSSTVYIMPSTIPLTASS